MARSVTVMILTALILCCAGYAGAETYYVDFASGSDTADGRSPRTAFKHAPGDRDAEGVAGEVKLAPGDKVVFKGGVTYYGEVQCRWSGAPTAPIVFDGNTDGAFGEGPAVIDGSEPLSGWTRCRSAADCAGNPNWRNIYYTDAPEGTNPFWCNLTQDDRLMAVAQDPNLPDMFWEDDLANFQPINPPNPASESGLQITKGPGMAANSSRPYVLMFDGNRRTSAILDPCVGASMTFRFSPAVTVHSFGIEAVPSYTMPKDFVLLADGKRALSATLANERGIQKFELPRPVTFSTLELKITSAHPEEPSYAAIAEIQGYDAQGENVLLSPPVMRYKDSAYFTQDDADFWRGAYFTIWAGSNQIFRRKVVGFEPETDSILFDMLSTKQYSTGGKFAMMNALGILDRPGEYVVDEEPRPDGTRRIYAWPLDATPKRILRSVRRNAFALRDVSYVTVQGFKMQKQGGRSDAGAVNVGGSDYSNVVIRDNEMTLIRSGRFPVIYVAANTNSNAIDCLIAGNHVHHNRRAAGIQLRRGMRSVIRGNVLDKNGATGMVLYWARDCEVRDNVVSRHKGVHANGLTAYLDCQGVLFDGNRVFDGNVCLTTQQSKRIVVRNNIFDGHGVTSAIGLWNVGTLEDFTLVNNLILRSPKDSTWAAGIYGGGSGPTGFVIKNNVIDGLSGEIDGDISHNIWTRWGPSQTAGEAGPGSLYEPDLSNIFVDPENHDYRLRPGSPAIDAGTEVGIQTDIEGTPVPQGAAPDIGPYERPAP